MTAAVIPTGHEASGYVCVQSLGRQGVTTVVASDRERVPAASSRYCDEAVDLPPPREDLLAYRDALLELADRPTVAAVVPVRPVDGYVLSKYRTAFTERASVVAPPPATIERVHDRLALAAAAEAAGVPVPETRLLTDVEDWSDQLLVKSRYNVLTGAYVDGFDPSDADVVNDIRHLEPDSEPDVERVRETYRHVPVVQEFVPRADEYMFAALYDHGEPLATFQHRQIRGNSYTGGGGVYRESVSIPELESVARRLLDHLDWHGLACIEYMEDAETGEFVLTEINPRMWQSLPSTVRAGVDFPYYYWLQATGRAEEVDPTYETGVGSHLLYGELGYLLSIVREDSPLVTPPSLAWTALEITSSCATEPYFDYFSLDDPAPFFRGLLNKVPLGI